MGGGTLTVGQVAAEAVAPGREGVEAAVEGKVTSGTNQVGGEGTVMRGREEKGGKGLVTGRGAA